VGRQALGTKLEAELEGPGAARVAPSPEKNLGGLLNHGTLTHKLDRSIVIQATRETVSVSSLIARDGPNGGEQAPARASRGRQGADSQSRRNRGWLGRSSKCFRQKGHRVTYRVCHWRANSRRQLHA